MQGNFPIKTPASQVSQKSGFLFGVRVCFAGTGMCATRPENLDERRDCVGGVKKKKKRHSAV